MPKRCWHSGKRSYRSKQQADDAKHTIQNIKGEDYDPDLYSYKCHYCNCWHHGGSFRRQMREGIKDFDEKPLRYKTARYKRRNNA